jgi:hypothetical protein
VYKYKKNCNLLISISVIFLILGFYWPSWAQHTKTNYQKEKTSPSIENETNTESPSDGSAKEIPKKSPKIDPPSYLSAKEIPKKSPKIDQVGEKVGQQIDDLTKKASSLTSLGSNY